MGSNILGDAYAMSVNASAALPRSIAARMSAGEIQRPRRLTRRSLASMRLLAGISALVLLAYAMAGCGGGKGGTSTVSWWRSHPLAIRN